MRSPLLLLLIFWLFVIAAGMRLGHADGISGTVTPQAGGGIDFGFDGGFGGGGAVIAPPGSPGKVLLVDGSSHILLVDGTSQVCRAGGC